jgi:serine/threonine protein phosphatase PrpC
MTPPVELPDRRPEHQQVNAYGLTHPGKVRETNQDHFMTCSLRKFMQVHHTSVVERAEEHPSRRGMATTLCYVYREGELTQISRDQTMAQELVDDGVLTRSDADNTQWAHVLSSAIGGSQTAPVVSRMHDVWDTVGCYAAMD